MDSDSTSMTTDSMRSTNLDTGIDTTNCVWTATGLQGIMGPAGADGVDGTSGSSTFSIDTQGVTMEADCDIKIGERSLKDFMDSVEQRLGILRPNPELEEKWANLKGLRQAYMDLEREIMEKEKMWTALGRTQSPVDK